MNEEILSYKLPLQSNDEKKKYLVGHFSRSDYFLKHMRKFSIKEFIEVLTRYMFDFFIVISISIFNRIANHSHFQ